MSEQTWIPCPPADGGRWPTEADSEGRELDVQHADGLRSVKPWDAVKAYNGYDCNKNKIVAWQSLPAPYVPPEPEPKERKRFQNVNTILWTDEDGIPSRYEFPHEDGCVDVVYEQPASPPIPDGWRVLEPGEEVKVGDRSFTHGRFGIELPRLTSSQQFDFCQPYIRRIEPASEPEKPKRRRFRSVRSLCWKDDSLGRYKIEFINGGFPDLIEQLPGDLDPDACREVFEEMEVLCYSMVQDVVQVDTVLKWVERMRRTNDAD